MTDAEVIDAIKRVLIDDKDWSPDTLDNVLAVLIDAGRMTWGEMIDHDALKLND